MAANDWAQILGGIGLTIVVEPVHEGGHAIATLLLTGAWPEIGLWAVHPRSGFASRLDALIVLRRWRSGRVRLVGSDLLAGLPRPQYKWALVGPSLMATIALVSWMVAALLVPFGHSEIGASDAAKFLSLSGLAPWVLAVILAGITGFAAFLVTRYFRLPSTAA